MTDPYCKRVWVDVILDEDGNDIEIYQMEEEE